jgi:putative nucleotidyltransferase with HDIG domain
MKMFIGGFLLISAMLGGLTLKRIGFVALTLTLIFQFVFFSWLNALPLRAILIQGTIFYLSLALTIGLSLEIKKHIEELNERKHENCKLTNELIMSFIEAIDAKDHYLHNHSHNVCQYSLILGKAMGLTDSEIKSLGLAAIFHDIGKLRVSEEILNKPDKLNFEEWAIMKSHPTNGTQILQNVEKFQKILPIIKYHHRYFNGSGYPEDSRDEEIPLSAHIIMVADSFDAMTSDRPYRKALSEETAFEELRRFSGSQFNPKVVDAFFEAGIRAIPYTEVRAELPDLCN